MKYASKKWRLRKILQILPLFLQILPFAEGIKGYFLLSLAPRKGQSDSQGQVP